jgi:16S rRNA G527 N7-methylase RsmG
MNHKEMLLEEVFEKTGDKVNKREVAEKVGQFLKRGNVFLLFEVMNLRGEIEELREAMKRSQTDDLSSHRARKKTVQASKRRR